MDKILETIIKECLKIENLSERKLIKIKRKEASKYNLSLPSNIDLLKVYHKMVEEKRVKRNKKLEKLLIKRKIRSLSGIVTVSVLTKTWPCPGKCIFCPTEKGMPKSYISGEPAAERAKSLNFDPYLQVKKRIEMLKNQGHPTEKIELRIIGGSFTYYPEKYQIWFVKECFRGANEKSKSKIKLSPEKTYEQKSKSQLLKELKKEQKINENAKHRIIGMSIETRPDLINENEIKNLRELGVTMVEIGVQTIFSDILKLNGVADSNKNIINTTKLLKDAGFKVMYQMMPNLLGSNIQKDKKMFEIIYKDPNFKPDWIKIYPCVVIKNTKLHKFWKEGKYHPYSDQELINLLVDIKEMTPYFVRISRIFRDIPAPQIEAGCKISNIREVVLKKMKERNEKCHCIRCREVKENYNPNEKMYLFREDFIASGGKEIFLSFESKTRDKLYAFLRLRKPSNAIFPCLKNSSIIRELHTYGQALDIGEKDIVPQHQGLGKKLIKEAEKITKKEFKLSKIAVISGVGVREYYRKLGYRLKNTYMIKKLI